MRIALVVHLDQVRIVFRDGTEMVVNPPDCAFSTEWGTHNEQSVEVTGSTCSMAGIANCEILTVRMKAAPASTLR